jgi:2-methylcitrate dehydratase PrpD
MQELRPLFDWAAARRWQDLPARVRRRARWILADDLAAMIAAASEPEVEAYRRMIEARASVREATIVGPGLPRTDRWQAASANGVAITWCELDEGFRLATCHAGAYAIPALLAEADAAGLTLADVLASLVVSYECVTRFATCFRSRTPKVHTHALWSPVGAALAVSHARHFDAKQMFDAVTAATTLGSLGPRPHLVEGVLVRNGWAAAGAVAGMQCADWAQCGIGGAASSAPAVYRDILGADVDAGALTDGLGEQWAVESGYHKLHACCQHGHSAVEAIQDALREAPIDADAVESIEAFTHPLAYSLGNAHPKTGLGAKLSMPHMIAATLVYGSADAASFAPPALADPRVARLRARVRLMRYEGDMTPPFDRPARLVMTLATGERRIAECRSARGGPDRPLSDAELRDKIARLSSPVLPGLAQLVDRGDDDDADRPWRAVLESMA